MRVALLVAALGGVLASSACTPGAPSAPPGGMAGAPGTLVIEASLISYKPMGTPNGVVAGYNPASATVARGTVIQFHNQDNFNHTATFIGTTGFPTTSPFTSAALTPSGNDLSSPGWSTGDMPGGAFSRSFTASVPGTHFYGCFFHYTIPMRGFITVQ